MPRAREIIVPGARDLIPPQGRVTVQLLHPETGRIRQEIKAENVISDWWLAQAAASGRYPRLSSGVDTINSQVPNYSPNGACIESGFTNDGIWSNLGVTGVWPSPFVFGYVPTIWCSSSALTPNAAKPWIPSNNTTDGALTAWGRTDLAQALDAARLQRGSLIAAQSWSKYAQSRMVLEWGTTAGIGTYRSIGVGVVNATQAGNLCAPGIFDYYIPIPIRGVQPSSHSDISTATLIPGFNSTVFPMVIANTPKSMAFVSASEIWSASFTSVLYKHDLVNNTLLVGPSSATITGAGQVGVAVIGADLWISRAKFVKRCVKFTNTTLTVTDTYDHTTDLGAETYLDLTTDGVSLYALTATKVFVINATTGAVTTSFTHGITIDPGLSQTIEWDPKMDHLWINSSASGGTSTTPVAADYWSGPTPSGSSWVPVADRLRSISKVGVLLPYIVRRSSLMYSSGAIANWEYSLLTGMSPTGWVGFQTSHNAGNNVYQETRMFGPNMVSHALLGADVVKTGADVLKIVYDFDFA